MEPWGTRSAREGHLEPLDRDTCLALLPTAAIGRLSWPAPGGRPEVVPVNFLLDGGDLVFRTSRHGGEVVAVEHGVPLSFEVDDVEPALRVGWSVLVSGRAEIVTDPAEVARLEELAEAPWVALAEPVFVRLRPAEIIGRRLPLHPGGVTVAPP
ncbi:pyridoxamine 5'-phosphate oxidase family protein [Actinomadura sp. ATCC 31491]|uniref:Pyridoxamine 5'-phosphate oxidase family protein n=1 Tax=Actinomadura luzonensis TaxID=2805427 RepID=A0ABT0G5I8_9ACTN|nr:pyridoxamine 5'-phosphate oxidase family protein [Actinomadura luzonensis]MCK2219358.1 pyridoxamine 5'-phosphate oxidase family protein [Actinomadura luzonensis]